MLFLPEKSKHGELRIQEFHLCRTVDDRGIMRNRKAFCTFNVGYRPDSTDEDRTVGEFRKKARKSLSDKDFCDILPLADFVRLSNCPPGMREVAAPGHRRFPG